MPTPSPSFFHPPRIDLTILLRSLGYSEECLGLHYGDLHEADLGDGDGKKKEYFLARQHYFPVWGTCWESLAGLSLSSVFPQPSNLGPTYLGGQHFRAWKQNGTKANSGAWFIGFILLPS